MNKGAYTKKVNGVLEILPKEIEKENGELVKINKRWLDNTACDIVNAQLEQEGRDTERKKHYAHLNKVNNPLNRLIADELGEFYLCFYNRIKELENQYLTRFTYLCSYLNRDGYLVKDHSYIKIIDKDLQKLLRLSERETRNTKNALIENKLISIEQDGSILIKPSIAKKGLLQGVKKDEFSRVFIDGIRSLYESSTAREHKKIGIFFKLLPYVNKHHNIICSMDTVNNIKISDIKALSMREIAEILGYSVEHNKKLQKDLLSIKLQGRCAIALTLIDNVIVTSVNPMIYYRGNDIDKLRALINLFKIVES